MPRPKKFTPAQAQVLKTDALRQAVITENDIINIPGFRAQTIGYSPSIGGVVFASSTGQQVVVKLDPAGLTQWNTLTRR